VVNVKAEGSLSQLTPLSHYAPYLRTSMKHLASQSSVATTRPNPQTASLVAAVTGYLHEAYWNASSSGFA
jgi:hypothetical protein